MVEWADGVWGVDGEQRTAIAGIFVWNQAIALLPEGGLERHRQTCGAVGKPFRREGLPVVSPVGPRDSGKATGGMEVGVK
jgi:hypothetical protein